MKSAKKKRKSLASQLVRTYLVLTVSTLIAFFVNQMIAIQKFNTLFPFNHVEALIEALKTENLDEIDNRLLRSYLDRRSEITIFDAEGRYISGAQRDDIPRSFTELNLVKPYDNHSIRKTTNLTDADGNLRQLILIEQRNDPDQSGYILLDEERNIVDSSMALTTDKFSAQELQFLLGNLDSDYSLSRYAYERADGEKRIALISLYRGYDDNYDEAYDFYQYASLAMLVLYIILMIGSILRLNKKTKTLLRPLSKAIDNLKLGEGSTPISYDGPQEFVDIYSSFNELSAELEKSEDERAKLDAEKKRILTDISHDLRTPVTVISGYAQALIDGVVPEPLIPQYLKTMEMKAEQLRRLIDNFFTYSLLDHPSLLFDAKRQNLVDVVQAYFADKYQEIDLEGFKLDIQLPESPVAVDIDLAQMQRVFDNLLGNAMNHNPPDTTITVQLTSSDGYADLVIGNDHNAIPEALQDSIFEPFIIKDSSRGNAGHSGLGLAITAKILRRHGGTATLLIPPPDGMMTAISLRLPLSKENDARDQ